MPNASARLIQIIIIFIGHSHTKAAEVSDICGLEIYRARVLLYMRFKYILKQICISQYYTIYYDDDIGKFYYICAQNRHVPLYQYPCILLRLLRRYILYYYCIPRCLQSEKLLSGMSAYTHTHTHHMYKSIVSARQSSITQFNA